MIRYFNLCEPLTVKRFLPMTFSAFQVSDTPLLMERDHWIDLYGACSIFPCSNSHDDYDDNNDDDGNDDDNDN